MKRRSVARAALAATGALALAAGTAGAHPSDMLIDDGFLNSALDEHQTYGHGAEGSVPGRKELPSGPEELGLKLIGKTINAPEFGEGRVADVSAKGNYAYLTMFYEPTCGRGGVQIVDISNPAEPEGRRLHPEPRRHLLRRGLAGRDAQHPVLQGRPARLPERVVPAAPPTASAASPSST